MDEFTMKQRRLADDHSNVPEPVKEYIHLQIKLLYEQMREQLEELEERIDMINSDPDADTKFLKELDET